MRLIDADAFEEFTRKNCKDTLVDLWCELIRRQPTVYDIDKVVEQLEGRCRKAEETVKRLEGMNYRNLSDKYARIVLEIQRAVAIVKEGGVDGR